MTENKTTENISFDFGNYYIYKLVNPKNKCYYIGSTTLTLQDRLSRHKARYFSTKTETEDGHLSEIFKENIDDVEIEIIDTLPINPTLSEENKRLNMNVLENYNIRIAKIKEEMNMLNNLPYMIVLNQKNAVRTKEDFKKYYKDRYENNKERLKAYQREYYRKNKERCKAKVKERNEKIKAGTYQPRVAKYNYDDRTESIMCECGGKYKKNNLRIHKTTQKHQKYLTSQNLVVEE